MGRQTRAIGFGAALLLGCHSPAPSPSRAPESAPLVIGETPRAPSPTLDAGVAPVLPDDGTLVVTDRGAEPRVALRYAPVAGRTDRRIVTVQLRRSNELPENALTLRFVLDVTPKAVTSGEWTFDVKIVEASWPEHNAADNKRLRPLAGVKGKFTLSVRGEASAIDFDDHALDNEAAPYLELMDAALFFVPLPEVPVGRGATWEQGFVRPSDGDAGPPGTSRTRYTLTQISPAGGAVTAETATKKPRHPYGGRGLPTGAFLEETGHASQSYEITLDHVVSTARTEMVFVRHFDLRQTDVPDKSSDVTFTTRTTIETPK